jgi:hypothetical protein
MANHQSLDRIQVIDLDFCPALPGCVGLRGLVPDNIGAHAVNGSGHAAIRNVEPQRIATGDLVEPRRRLLDALP